MNTIVLVHGLGANPWLMSLLARNLKQPGMRVINWGYPSCRGSIQTHAARLSQLLDELDDDQEVDKLHLVAHSMGNIVARTALLSHIPQKMGRMVMLAPPNRGSKVAAFWRPLLGRWCQPIAELSNAADSYVCTLPKPQGLDFGIITAKRDMLVAPELTVLDGERDRTQIASWHSGILFRRDTAEQVRHFLQAGKFAHN